jgi:hypothetical protein
VTEVDRLLDRLQQEVATAARAEVIKLVTPLELRSDGVGPALRRTARVLGVPARARRRRRAMRSSAASTTRAPSVAIDRSLFLDPDRAHVVLARIVAERGLARRLTDVLVALVAGVPRRHLSTVLGIAENSVKTYVGVLLDRLKKRDLTDVVWWARNQIAKQPKPRRRARRSRRKRTASAKAPATADRIMAPEVPGLPIFLSDLATANEAITAPES